ncbi:MAG TPA: hypothetical protein VKA15_19765 [Isosphaeraceae bacterium]|nr:hypothetical protein [Isosphaeraceae bacterium]
MAICKDRLATAGLIVLACGLAPWGCGSGAPYAESSRTEAKVKGRVMSVGQPVAKGQVIFDPANVNRPAEPARTAEIRKDGTFEVTTLIGANRVTVAIPSRPRKKIAPYVQQVCEVHAGENTFDITLP